MKIYYSMFLFVVISILIFCCCGYNQDDILNSNKISECTDNKENIVVLEFTDDIKWEFDYVDRDREVTNRIFAHGCINNATTAIEIARAIFISVCTEDDTDYYTAPLEAYYDDINNYWLIRSYFPEDINYDGGRMYIIMKASNAEVVMICGTL